MTLATGDDFSSYHRGVQVLLAELSIWSWVDVICSISLVGSVVYDGCFSKIC